MENSVQSGRSEHRPQRANGLRIGIGSVLSVLVLVLAAYVGLSLLAPRELTDSPKQISVDVVPATAINAPLSTIAAALNRDRATEETRYERNPRVPLWVRIDIPTEPGKSDQVLEIKALRFDGARFWLVYESGEIKPETVSMASQGASRLIAGKGGYALKILERERLSTVFAEITHYTSENLQVSLWQEDDYSKSALEFERRGGALFGSLLILATFSAIVAFLNRDMTFLLFCGWIVTALRVAAINAGWDKYWLGIDIPLDTYRTFLRVSIAAYGFFTVALFRLLLITEHSPKVARTTFKALQYLFLFFITAAPIAEHVTFFKAFWAFAASGLSVLTVYLFYELYSKRSWQVAWYALSWGAMIAGMACEIGTQSGAIDVPTWINSQTASVVSALIMGLALAQRLNTERDARLKAQADSVSYLKKYQDNFNSMPVGLFRLRPDGRLAIFNPAFAELFSIPTGADTQSVAIENLLGSGAFEKLLRASERGEREIELSVMNESPARWLLVRFSMTDGTLEGSIQDVTSRKIAEQQLRDMVDHDSLTGLLNRRGIENALRDEISKIQDNRTCAMAYIDIDRFKLINDLYGHATGDAILQEGGARLSAAVRTRDQIARLADSFILLLPDYSSESLQPFTERIRKTFSDEPFTIGDKKLNLSVSVGIVWLEPSMTYIDAITAADRACAEAKARGRNCVVVLSQKDAELRAHLEELQVVADFQRKTPTEKFFLEFQPIIALHSALNSLNYEVLIRMREEDGRIIPPGKFIGAAERNGLMSQIDRWVLRNTLEWLDTHPQHRDRLSFATINISGASLNDTRFVDDAFSMIAEHPKAMPKLCFEITESVALNDLRSTRRFVDRIRMYGSKLALDDFGAGYTSFNYLKEIPADFIKIDGTFVKDINKDPANYAITRTIVELTHELGMRSIAEWAESGDVVASLCDLGVDYGQGFALARPMPKELVTEAESSGALIRDHAVAALLADRAGSPSAHARSLLPLDIAS